MFDSGNLDHRAPGARSMVASCASNAFFPSDRLFTTSVIPENVCNRLPSGETTLPKVVGPNVL